MAEQADQQWPVQKKPSDQRKGVHSERSNQQHASRKKSSIQKTRLPSHIASWTGHTTAHLGILQQHQSQSPQLHRGPPANQPRSHWFIIARSQPEASSLHGNTTLLRSQHHSTADDKITASKPRPHCTTLTLRNIYMYVWYCSCHSNTTLQDLHSLKHTHKYTPKKQMCACLQTCVQVYVWECGKQKEKWQFSLTGFLFINFILPKKKALFIRTYLC